MRKDDAPRRTPSPATLTVVEAAKVLRIGRNQAYDAIRRGEIPVIRIGKRMLVPASALERLLSGEIVQAAV